MVVGWCSLVEDDEKSCAPLMILYENKAHVSDHEKHYDELIHVTFDGQLKSNGDHDGNALFHVIRSGKANLQTER